MWNSQTKCFMCYIILRLCLRVVERKVKEAQVERIFMKRSLTGINERKLKSKNKERNLFIWWESVWNFIIKCILDQFARTFKIIDADKVLRVYMMEDKKYWELKFSCIHKIFLNVFIIFMPILSFLTKKEKLQRNYFSKSLWICAVL